jgi:SAM-dependent methyltransferase
VLVTAFNSIVKNGEISISEAEWARLNKQFTQELIIDLISDTIEEYNLLLPLRQISLQEAINDFKDLQSLDCRRLWRKGDLFTKHKYRYPITNKYIELHTFGNKASDFFHQKNRYSCSSANSPSPQRIWTTEKLRKNWLKSLWSMKYKEINLKVLREALALRGYVASLFRPSAAKAIYELLESKDVLDFASGYGSRLIGFCAAPKSKSYFGCDPNQNLFEGYQKQIKQFGAGKKITIINSPAEEMDFGKEQFDTVFTSPPFFRAERYTHDENQSWMRYKTLNSWLDEFLYKVIEKSWRALKPRGFLAMNLADVYHDKKLNKFTDATNDFIMTLPDSEFILGVGLRLHFRPQKGVKDHINTEPIWVFRKKQ